MLQLIPGQKTELAQAGQTLTLTCAATCKRGEIDFTCFGVDGAGKLSDERYFIFYNQLESPEGAICKTDGQDRFTLALSKLPPSVERLVFTAAMDGGVMSDLTGGSFTLSCADGPVAACTLSQDWFHKEKAVILCEMYRRGAGWRLSTVCRGFDGGLSALLAHFGGEEASVPAPQAASTPPEPPPAAAATISLSKGEQVQKVVLQKAPHLIDLTKKAAISLEKKQLSDVRAQVVLVLDVSGSMDHQYHNGRVQRLLDKVLPLALLFDDDGVLDVWGFANRHRRLTAATLDNIAGYVDQVDGGWKNWDIGAVNNEPPVMQAIFEAYRVSALPVYVLFISDGGITQSKKIQKVITQAAHAPLFWQFVGIGGQGYGVLEKLDSMRGRVVDNAGFFALDDVDSVSDEALYDRLMHEFPKWRAAAQAAGIL